MIPIHNVEVHVVKKYDTDLGSNVQKLIKSPVRCL